MQAIKPVAGSIDCRLAIGKGDDSRLECGFPVVGIYDRQDTAGRQVRDIVFDDRARDCTCDGRLIVRPGDSDGDSRCVSLIAAVDDCVAECVSCCIALPKALKLSIGVIREGTITVQCQKRAGSKRDLNANIGSIPIHGTDGDGIAISTRVGAIAIVGKNITGKSSIL